MIEIAGAVKRSDDIFSVIYLLLIALFVGGFFVWYYSQHADNEAACKNLGGSIIWTDSRSNRYICVDKDGRVLSHG